jgi:hypothetical protein
MAEIIKIEVEIKSGDVANAGNDGDIYFGICGGTLQASRNASLARSVATAGPSAAGGRNQLMARSANMTLI